MCLYAKWRAKLLETITRSNGNSDRYEYDDQNRMTKLSFSHRDTPLNPYQTDEITYNAGGDPVKLERKNAENPASEFIEEYVIQEKIITITYKRSGLPDLILTMNLNSDGYPASREYLSGAATAIHTYSCMNGNLTKTSDIRDYGYISVPMYDYEYEYDQMKTVHFNWNVPNWFMIHYFESAGSKNNVTKASHFVYAQTGENEFTRQLTQTTDYTWEYDNDGFPVKSKSKLNNGSEIEILYGYN